MLDEINGEIIKEQLVSSFLGCFFLRLLSRKVAKVVNSPDNAKTRQHTDVSAFVIRTPGGVIPKICRRQEMRQREARQRARIDLDGDVERGCQNIASEIHSERRNEFV